MSIIMGEKTLMFIQKTPLGETFKEKHFPIMNCLQLQIHQERHLTVFRII